MERGIVILGPRREECRMLDLNVRADWRIIASRTRRCKANQKKRRPQREALFQIPQKDYDPAVVSHGGVYVARHVVNLIEGHFRRSACEQGAIHANISRARL
jgi:hypothetical protein